MTLPQVFGNGTTHQSAAFTSLPHHNTHQRQRHSRSQHCNTGPFKSQQGRHAAAAQAASSEVAQEPLASLRNVQNDRDRLALLKDFASRLPEFPAEKRTFSNRVMGCTTQVWVSASLREDGAVQLEADSDSQLSKGLCAVMVEALNGQQVQDVLRADATNFVSPALDSTVLTPSRTNGFLNMLEAIKRQVRGLTNNLPAFPSLLISADEIVPQGRFAEAQAEFLSPGEQQVRELVKVLSEKKIGVVAHFYMDPEVQGVLTSARKEWPHIQISDSLVMADKAVDMARAGCKAIGVLGVDFMSENVRAILDEAGHQDVAVYRMSSETIGCSLAEAAESDAYQRYLEAASQDGHPGLHVVYINTSLRTKALAHTIVPTITCTSSNVVQTVLQAFAQVPDLRVWYGPDTYMGRNIAQLFRSLADMSDDAVAKIHPGHTAASIQSLLPRLHYFDDGICIVHHMFGAQTTDLVRQAYGDALLSAHFEVPGEMFTLAMEAQARGRGVVGSTSNILSFISHHVSEAIKKPFVEPLKVVLGTESGMITSIVRKVQSMLKDAKRDDIKVEVVFPVAPDAMVSEATANLGGTGEATLPGGLKMVPGAASGEGCSTEGGCASCPFMKMNTLRQLQSICEKIGTPAEALLEAYKPKAYDELLEGRTIASIGCEPILHMRDYQAAGKLSQGLVEDIASRQA